LIRIDCRDLFLYISESDIRLLGDLSKHFQGAFPLPRIVRGPSNCKTAFKNVKLLTQVNPKRSFGSRQQAIYLSDKR